MNFFKDETEKNSGSFLTEKNSSARKGTKLRNADVMFDTLRLLVQGCLTEEDTHQNLILETRSSILMAF